jgi:hypothetical protein
MVSLNVTMFVIIVISVGELACRIWRRKLKVAEIYPARWLPDWVHKPTAGESGDLIVR